MKKSGIIKIVTLHILFTIFITSKGHFTDSFLYLLEVKNLVKNGSFALINGYEETKSQLMRFPQTATNNGHQYSQYPAIYSIIAYPFYFISGEAGLFFINSLAFIGIVLLQIKIANILFEKESISYLSVLILVLGTYFWYYSQDIWPHTLQCFLIMLSSYMLIKTLVPFPPTSYSSKISALLISGMALGCAIGVRVDSIFALPSIGILVLTKEKFVKHSLFFVSGVLLFFLPLGYFNHIKFGTYSPFSYGNVTYNVGNTSLGFEYLYLGYTLVLLHLIYFLFYAENTPNLPKYRKYLIYIVLLLLILWTLFNDKLLRGLGVILLDMRFLESNILEEGMLRGENGAVIYGNLYKLAFIQSVPFALLTLIPLFTSKNRENRYKLLWLYLLPASFILVFSALKWHGGNGYDMRYLLPALPFLSIIMAYTIDNYLDAKRFISTLREDSKLHSIIALLFITILTIAIFQKQIPELISQSLFLTAPIILSVTTFFLVFYKIKRNKPLSNKIIFLICVTILWGGLMSLRSYVFQNDIRHTRESIANIICPHITENSLIIGWQMGLLNKLNNSHFAIPYPDHIDDLKYIIPFYLNRKSDVYILSDDVYIFSHKAGYINNYEVQKIALEKNDFDIPHIYKIIGKK